MLARSILILVFCFALLIPPVNAAPLDQFVNNDLVAGNGLAPPEGFFASLFWYASSNLFETDQVFLFLDASGGVTFEGWTQAPYSTGGWFGPPDPVYWTNDVMPDPNFQLSASGEPFGTNRASSGRFGVEVSDNTQSFNLEYAFLLNGELVGSGTGYWDGNLGQWANWDGAFDPDHLDNLHAPISGTVWLMASGILALVGIRRGKPMRRN